MKERPFVRSRVPACRVPLNSDEGFTAVPGPDLCRRSVEAGSCANEGTSQGTFVPKCAPNMPFRSPIFLCI
jgi:hypothetical protein